MTSLLKSIQSPEQSFIKLVDSIHAVQCKQISLQESYELACDLFTLQYHLAIPFASFTEFSQAWTSAKL